MRRRSGRRRASSLNRARVGLATGTRCRFALGGPTLVKVDPHIARAGTGSGLTALVRPEAGHRASRWIFRLSDVVFADFDQRQWNEPSLRSRPVGLLDPKSYSLQRGVPVAKEAREP